MVNFSKILGLEQLKHDDGILGIFDGDEMRITTSSYSAVTLAKLFWRYGLDIYNIRSWVKDVTEKFSRIYTIQDAGFAYTSVMDLLQAMDPVFVKYMKKSIKSVLKADGYSDRFIDEFVTGAMRTNYGQNADIHGFVGAVSLAGVEPGLWSVKGGNYRIPENLIPLSKINLIQGDVKSITLLEYQESNYELRYLPTSPKLANNAEIQTKGYDVIVIANPMHDGFPDIKFEDFPNEIKNFPQKFHRIIATFVDGVPNNTHYGFENLDGFPSTILTCKNDLFLNSYGKHNDVLGNPAEKSVGDRSVGKIFTNRPPTEQEVNIYFKKKEDVRMVNWLAYPEYDFDIDNLPPFVLHDNMYYINGIEMAASAMEMSVIGARNVALLSYNHWYGHLDKIDEPYVDPSQKSDKAEL
ncbi:hypothetical protein FSP39_009872 [Pinctada imbricata]|uniref:Prenylcysteine lyase domain-containing protein n=1 Tax=Pinctada imbricata TaxID=66713 RepID=A0AA88YLY2_PINIB|nr:hypothetical protein FSP39_009872 [Pinctada imbricata]